MKSLIIQKSLIKLLLAFVLSFLWAKYIQIANLTIVVNFPILFFGALYLMFAWFNYLRLDGLNPIPLSNKNLQKQKPKHKTKQMIDYVDTEIQEEVELSATELLKSKMYSNIICGILLVIPSFITLLN